MKKSDLVSKRKKRQDEVDLPDILEKFNDLEKELKVRFQDNCMSPQDLDLLFKNRGMSRNEVKYLFSTIDINHDGKLQEREWSSFFHLIIENMNECDGNKDSLIGVKGMTECVMYTDSFKNIKTLGEDGESFAGIMDKDLEEDSMNIFEFVFIRRLNLAWGECAAGGEELAMINTPCAMRIMVPGLVADLQDVKSILKSYNAIKTGKVGDGASSLDMYGFAQMSYIFYYFYAFQIPFVNGVVQKKDMLRAIFFQTLPTKMTENVINQLFKGSTEMNLEQFSLALLIYKSFRRAAKKNPNYLTEDEFVDCLGQKMFSKNILRKIEAIYLPTQEQYQNASDTVGTKYYTEKDMFMTFLQTNTITNNHIQTNTNNHIQTNTNNHKNQVGKNKKKRDDEESFDQEKWRVVYRQFEFKGKEQLEFSYFLRFYQLSWYFMNVDNDNNNVLSYQEIRDSIKEYEQPIKFDLQEEQDLHQVKDFISDPVVSQLDLKQLYAMFLYKAAFTFYRQANFNSFINEANLKKALYMLGFHTVQATFDLSQQGTDPTTQLPLYNYWVAFQQVLRLDVVCVKFYHYDQLQEQVTGLVG